MSSSVTYSIEVLAGNTDIQFDGTCPSTPSSSKSTAESLSGSTSYRRSFTVHACDTSGASVFASLLHGTRTIAYTYKFVRVTPPPAPPPTGLTVTRSTQNSVSLSWNSVSNASKYKLERSRNGSTGWISVDSEITDPTTSKEATGLDRCTTYYFRVSAAGNGSKYSTAFGDPSSNVSGTTTGCPTPTANPTPTAIPPTAIPAPAARPTLKIHTSGDKLTAAYTIPASTSHYHQLTLFWSADGNSTYQTEKNLNVDQSSQGNVLSPITKPGYYKVGLRACPDQARTASKCGPYTYNQRGPNGSYLLFPPSLPAPAVLVNSNGTSIEAKYTLPDAAFYYKLALYKVSQSTSPPTYDEQNTGLPFSPPRPAPPATTGSHSFTPTEAGMYAVGLTVCLNVARDNCPFPKPAYSSSATNITKLEKPAADTFDVIPLPSELNPTNGSEIQRKAKLTWSAVTSATGYVVEGRAPSGSWPAVPSVSSSSSREHMVVLDDVLVTNEYYDYRVIAVGRGFLNSEPSDTVRIVDSPILSIDGDSSTAPANQGKAVVKWASASDVDSSGYTLRFRELGNDHGGRSHTALLWEIDDQSLPGSFGANDKKTVTGSETTINNLNLDSIHAVQLNYTTTGGIHVFSGRDAYVLPTRTAPAANTLVASISVDHRGATKPFTYRICSETFPNEQFSATDTRNKREAWKQIIQHAFEQWEIATDGLIQMTYDAPTPQDPKECADYSDIIQEVVDEINKPSSRTDEQIRDDVREALRLLRENDVDVFDQPMIDDKTWNEVIMLDDVHGRLRTIIDAGSSRYAIFQEFADDLGYAWCRWNMGKEGCAPSSINDAGLKTTDVFLRRGAFEPGGAISMHSPTSADLLDIPGTLTPYTSTVRMNTCPATHQSSRAYWVLVHEAGHALGLGPVAPVHSNLPESVMHKYRLAYHSRQLCSPHPIDVMTIYAIYQTTN